MPENLVFCNYVNDINCKWCMQYKKLFLCSHPLGASCKYSGGIKGSKRTRQIGYDEPTLQTVKEYEEG